MAWGLRWQACFKSLSGQDYAIDIYEQEWEEEVTTLRCAVNPFVTQEDDDNDLFYPTRIQTGYLRLIDTNGTLMETLVPSNNTQRLVRLIKGTYSGIWPNGSFSPDSQDAIQWQGFLQAQAYTQPWDANATMVEIPVKSLLGALESVQMEQEDSASEHPIAYLLYTALSATGVTPKGVYIGSDMAAPATSLLKTLIQFSIFYQEETAQNEGEDTVFASGMNCSEALGEVLKLYGLCAREKGEDIHLLQYDSEGEIIWMYVTWDSLKTFAEGGIGMIQGPYYLTETAMLPSLIFKGNDNEVSFMQGYRNASVQINLKKYDQLIKMQNTNEDDSAVISLACYSGILMVQPHEPRTTLESSYFFVYNGYIQIGTSTYNEMLTKTVINGYNTNPYAFNRSLYTGAFPCRFAYRTGTEIVKLRNGIYLNTQYKTPAQATQNPTPHLCYSISGSIPADVQYGFIRMNFDWHSIIWVSPNIFLFDDAAAYFGASVMVSVYLSLQIGNLYWNGTAWTITQSLFSFNVINGSIVSNKNALINVDAEGGYFIPITQAMNGTITLTIWDAAPTQTQGSSTFYRYSYSHIVENIQVEHLYPTDITASMRSKNVYRKQILIGGFSEDKSINTIVGTFCNNYPSPSFLKVDSTTYLSTISYNVAGGTSSLRPEMHLLSRMVNYYGQVRRTLTAVVQNSLDLMQTLYSYRNRYFFGVRQETDWEEESETVKFIEVTEE